MPLRRWKPQPSSKSFEHLLYYCSSGGSYKGGLRGSCPHLTCVLDSRSKARGESRALEERCVSSKSPSRVRDWDLGSCWRNGRECCLLDREFFKFFTYLFFIYLLLTFTCLRALWRYVWQISGIHHVEIFFHKIVYFVEEKGLGMISWNLVKGKTFLMCQTNRFSNMERSTPLKRNLLENSLLRSAE